MPQAADPEEWVALHDMRIAAKRLRYVLEVTGHVFGPYATTATKHVKELQDLLGEIHDCDVQIPATAASGERLLEADAGALTALAGRRRGPRPQAAQAGAPPARPHRRRRARGVPARAAAGALRPLPRAVGELERKGFRARLEYAVSERTA